MTPTFRFDSFNFTSMAAIELFERLCAFVHNHIDVCMFLLSSQIELSVHDKHCCLTNITVVPTVNWQIVKMAQATSDRRQAHYLTAGRQYILGQNGQQQADKASRHD